MDELKKFSVTFSVTAVFKAAHALGAEAQLYTCLQKAFGKGLVLTEIGQVIVQEEK